MKHRTFDAVKFMRETRDGLSRKYMKNPEAQDKDLARIRKKFSKFKRPVAKKPLENARVG